MEEKHYKLRFLPLFDDDLNRAIDYIAFELENPEANLDRETGAFNSHALLEYMRQEYEKDHTFAVLLI